MPIMTFDKEKIRSYMENTETLRRGIQYMKQINPGLSDALAKESAIRYAQEKCAAIWSNDSRGYYDSEYKAFERFEEKVKNGSEFGMAPSQSFDFSFDSIIERFKGKFKLFLIFAAFNIIFYVVGLLMRLFGD